VKLTKTIKHFDWEIQFFEHSSVSTKTTMKFSVFLPDPKKVPDSALIWLSGLTCNEENFILKSGFAHHMADSNTMIICPDTSPRDLNLACEHESYDFGSWAGFYVNATTKDFKDNYNMYDYINTEIYNLVTKFFKIKATKISIFWHSMGGHWALIIWLNNPEKYQSISAFSPIVNPINAPWGKKAFEWYLGSNKKDWEKYDATVLLQKWNVHKKLILIDQGTNDDFLKSELLTNNLQKAADLSQQKIQINMREWYDHSYYFISTFLGNHIDFHLQHLK